MGRNLRVWSPSVYEHVIMRGNNRQTLFYDEQDMARFFGILDYTHEKYPFTIIAYCLMTNHYHLLIRSPEVPHGKIMAIINKRYSDYYKKKYNFTGTIYESRYFASKAITAKSLLAVSRYIHRNPIETNPPMVASIESYPHSSYKNYLHELSPQYAFLDFTQLFTLLPLPYEKTKEGYHLYCAQSDSEVPDTKVPDTNKT